MDQQEYRDRSRRVWGRMASSWAARSGRAEATMAVVNDWLIARTDPQPGHVVLDIAAGPGGLGHRIAPLVMPGGRVISTDFAQEMVDAARRLGTERGLTNVDYRTLDAERMDLDDDSVHIALCRSGFMLMTDPFAALSETRRVLRPGGALAFSVFGSAGSNPHVSASVKTLVERGHIAPPSAGGPGIFSMADPDRIREVVTAASFPDPEIEAINFLFEYSDHDDLWSSILQLQGHVVVAVNAMDADEREATRSAVIEAFAEYRNEDGSYSVPAMVWVALAS